MYWRLKLGDNIFYLVIENISREPLFLIDYDNNQIKKLIELNDNYEVDHLIIKFYRTKNEIIKNDLDYKFFFEKENPKYISYIQTIICNYIGKYNFDETMKHLVSENQNDIKEKYHSI
jgi:hypothetical protein